MVQTIKLNEKELGEELSRLEKNIRLLKVSDPVLSDLLEHVEDPYTDVRKFSSYFNILVENGDIKVYPKTSVSLSSLLKEIEQLKTKKEDKKYKSAENLSLVFSSIKMKPVDILGFSVVKVKRDPFNGCEITKMQQRNNIPANMIENMLNYFGTERYFVNLQAISDFIIQELECKKFTKAKSTQDHLSDEH